MKAIMLAVAVAMLAGVGASAANFPYIRLNNQTNRISDSGSALTRDGIAIGGSGSFPLTNIAGVVQYAPGQAATNVLNVVSGLANNATNVVLAIDTAAPWTDGFLYRGNNALSNVFAVSSLGGIYQGRSWTNWNGGIDADDTLLAYRDVAKGESHSAIIQQIVTMDGANALSTNNCQTYLESTVYDDGTSYCYFFGDSYDVTGSHVSSWDLGVQEGVSAFFILRADDINAFIVKPDIAAGSLPYLMRTTKAHTNGNILEVSNNGAPGFNVVYNGSITTGGNTNRWILKGLTVDGGTTNAHWTINGTNFFSAMTPE